MKTRNGESCLSSSQAWKGIPQPDSLKSVKKINFWNLYSPIQSHQPVSTHSFLLFLQKLHFRSIRAYFHSSPPILHLGPLHTSQSPSGRPGGLSHLSGGLNHLLGGLSHLLGGLSLLSGSLSRAGRLVVLTVGRAAEVLAAQAA